MSTDWTTARVVRDRDGKHALRIDDLPDARNFWTRGGFNMTGDALNLHYGPLTPILDAEGLPVVRTVGDLTARHIGKRVRLYDGPSFTLQGLQSFIRGELGDFVQLAAEWDDDDPDDDWDYTDRALDTPCDVLS